MSSDAIHEIRQRAYFEGRLDGINEVIDWFKSSDRSTKFRGHNMTMFSEVRPANGQQIFRSTCIRCGRGVDVILDPMPNQTNVSGDAAAVNCDG